MAPDRETSVIINFKESQLKSNKTFKILKKKIQMLLASIMDKEHN